MVKMMVMTTTMMEMMMKKKMGNHVVGKWLKSLWQMGVLASLNVRLQSVKLQNCISPFTTTLQKVVAAT